jgi:broad specificity phosphatase PhoE
LIKKIFLVRHGRARHNLNNIFAGNSLDQNITAGGIEDAHLLAKKIASFNRPISYIFCSSLIRSQETAEIIKNDLEQKSSKKIDLICIKELTEVNVGEFSGKSREEALRLYPVSAKAFHERKIESWNFPNGENYHQIVKRVRKAMYEVAELSPKEGEIVVVGHAMTNRIIISQFAPQVIKNHKYFHFEHDKVVEMTIDPERLSA